MTRDEKINAAAVAIHQAAGIKGLVTPLVRAMAEAAVDALDPPKRIQLTGGYDAVACPAVDGPPQPWRIEGPDEQIHGYLSTEAVEEWAVQVTGGRFKA